MKSISKVELNFAYFSQLEGQGEEKNDNEGLQDCEKNCQCDNGATNKCGITEVTLIIHIDGFLKGFIL